MYRCSVELSVRYDGQSQSQSEHTSLIAEHARLILWQVGSICVLILNTGFAPVVRLIKTLVQFCSKMLNRYLDLNTGFALVVKTLLDGTFSSIWVSREEIRTQRFMNTHAQFCGEHACLVSC